MKGSFVKQIEFRELFPIILRAQSPSTRELRQGLNRPSLRILQTFGGGLILDEYLNQFLFIVV